jgi:hypothetical protein
MDLLLQVICIPIMGRSPPWWRDHRGGPRCARLLSRAQGKDEERNVVLGPVGREAATEIRTVPTQKLNGLPAPGVDSGTRGGRRRCLGGPDA